MFGGDIEAVGVVWWVVPEGCDGGMYRDIEIRAGALGLRGVGLVFVEGDWKEGGTESRRGLVVLGRGMLELVVANFRGASARECFLLGGGGR